MASRVMLSTTISTCLPSSRKCSAMAMALRTARTCSTGDLSLVALHHHSARLGLGADLVVDELPDLPAALTHQCGDDDVGLGVAGDHAQQRALADARACHDRHALAAAQREEAVDGPDARL